MRRRAQRGAALLLALLIMTLVATLAAGMVWLQWRGIEVESAERARTQANWLLDASLDWGNLILKSSIRNGHTEDDLGQPWATPLAETKLSSFLSADGNHSDDSGPEAYLSGQITDAASKYNLYNVINDATKLVEITRLENLCVAIGVPASTADTIGAGLRASYSARMQADAGQAQPDPSVLMPVQVEDLAWYGIDPKVVQQLEPFVQLLPSTTTTNINANTAPAEVLMAAIPTLTRAQAQQLVLARQSGPFTAINKIWQAIGVANTGIVPPADGPQLQVDVRSDYFEIYGQLRYEQHVIRERSVIQRGTSAFETVKVLRRERIPPDPTT